jgi:hypothetical protein
MVQNFSGTKFLVIEVLQELCSQQGSCKNSEENTARK